MSRTFLRRLIGASWVEAAIRPFARAGVRHGTALMYHRVTEPSVRSGEAAFGAWSPNSVLSVSADRFERQVRWLKRESDCLSVPEMIEGISRGKLPRRAVVLTFDDGYRDNLTLALPILRAHRVPMTLYVTTGFIDGTSDAWWFELERRMRAHATGSIQESHSIFQRWVARFKACDALELKSALRELRGSYPEDPGPGTGLFLSWEELREMARDPLVTIGAHGVSHLALSRLSDRELQDEILISRARLEEELGEKIRHFAYPFGDETQAGDREFERVESLGFESAFTTRIGHPKAGGGSFPFAIPRLLVDDRDDERSLRRKLDGTEALLHRMKSVLR